MVRPSKKNVRDGGLADFLSAFHVLPFPLRYADYCGLLLLLDVPRYQRAAEGLLANLAASGAGRLGRQWFEALSRFGPEQDELEWQTNSARALSRAMRGKGA